MKFLRYSNSSTSCFTLNYTNHHSAFSEENNISNFYIITSKTNTHQKIIVNTDDIIYIEAIKTEKNALHFILKNDDVYCNGTINEWENKLGKTHFLTPYRGTLVNLNHIHIVEKTSLIMTNGDTLPLSRHYQKQVRSFFAKKTLNIFN